MLCAPIVAPHVTLIPDLSVWVELDYCRGSPRRNDILSDQRYTDQISVEMS